MWWTPWVWSLRIPSSMPDDRRLQRLDVPGDAEVAAQERDLVGDDALERGSDVQVEVPARVAAHLGLRRAIRRRLRDVRRCDHVVLGEHVEDRGGDLAGLASRPVQADGERD